MDSPLIPAQRHTRDLQNDRLRELITRIGAGDRAAFRTLYTFLAIRIWHYSVRLLPPIEARAVTRSTFVEIWQSAGHHGDHDAQETGAWILSIPARHVGDRIRSATGQDREDHDRRTHRELTSLLGGGQATVRAP
jgi:DNA-directed RNA polymerase specialized sigma24 family protein